MMDRKVVPTDDIMDNWTEAPPSMFPSLSLLLYEPALCELYLARSGLGAPALTLLSRLPSLRFLNLAENYLTCIPRAILAPLVLPAFARCGGAVAPLAFRTGFPSLAVLDLSRNPLPRDCDIGALLALPALREVDLSGSPCAAAALRALRRCGRGVGGVGGAAAGEAAAALGVGALALQLRWRSGSGATGRPRRRPLRALLPPPPPSPPPLLPPPRAPPEGGAPAALRGLLRPLLAFAGSGGGDARALEALLARLPAAWLRANAPRRRGGGFAAPWPAAAAAVAAAVAGIGCGAHACAEVARAVGAALQRVARARRGELLARARRGARAPPPRAPPAPPPPLQLVPLVRDAGADALAAALREAEGGDGRRAPALVVGCSRGACLAALRGVLADAPRPPPLLPPAPLAAVPLRTQMAALAGSASTWSPPPSCDYPPPPLLPSAAATSSTWPLDPTRYPLLASFPPFLPVAAPRAPSRPPPPPCCVLPPRWPPARALLPASYTAAAARALRALVGAPTAGAPRGGRLYERRARTAPAPPAPAPPAPAPRPAAAPGYRAADLFRGRVGFDCAATGVRRARAAPARSPPAAAWATAAAARPPPPTHLRGRLALPPSGVVATVLDAAFACGSGGRGGAFTNVVLAADARADVAAVRAAGAGGAGPPPRSLLFAEASQLRQAPHRVQHRFLLPALRTPAAWGGGGGEGGATFGGEGAGGAHPAAALRAAARARHATAAATVDTLEALLAATDSRAGANIGALGTVAAVESGALRRGLLGRVRDTVAEGERLRAEWA